MQVVYCVIVYTFKYIITEVNIYNEKLATFYFAYQSVILNANTIFLSFFFIISP